MLRTVLALLAVSLVVLPGSALGDTPTLTAIVGTNDGFDITLNDPEGKKVSRILPGTYTIVVDDRSTIHNFHLASNSDPTVDFRTDLEFVGKQSFTVTFLNHTTYAYACEPHWQTMNGSFLVTDTPVAPPPPPPPQTAGRQAEGIGLGIGRRTAEPVVGPKRPRAHRRDRPVEEGELPPPREGRRQEDGGQVPRVGELEPAAFAGDVPVRKRRTSTDEEAPREVRLPA